jgi:predicted transport protein
LVNGSSSQLRAALHESNLNKQIEVDWSSPRLMCIAKDFTRYDDYAIGQINRNIELIRYRFFEGDNIIFEQAGTSQITRAHQTNKLQYITKYRDMEDAISASSNELLSLYQELEDYIFSLGDDVQKKELKYYHAYSRIKNFVCTEIRSKKQEIVLFLKLNYKDLQSPPKNSRDVSKIGHYGTGDTEVTIKSIEELEEIKGLIEKSYGNG